MIKSQHRNLSVTYPDHTHISSKMLATFDSVSKKLQTLCLGLNNRLASGAFTESQIAFVRLAKNTHLCVVVATDDVHQFKNNPYLFVFEAGTKTVSTEISHECFEKLNNPYVWYTLEDNIKRMDKWSMPFNISGETFKSIINNVREYDISE